MRLSDVIEELIEERGLERDELSSIICEGILAGYKKRYPDLELRVQHNKKTDEVAVEVQKSVVSSVEDEDLEITVRKARTLKKTLKAGDQVWAPFEGVIGRIEILKAKQVIAQQLKTIEAQAVYEEFKDKVGDIILGSVHKVEHAGTSIKLGEALAFLPKSLSIPGERLTVGTPVRALLKEVLPEPRHENQLILDRASEGFLRRLFELEIPEVYEQIVEIKKIVRVPGYKSKVAVISHDRNIDPVGTCVGVGGVRIRPILKELGSEKVDIIAWSEFSEEFVKGALKPAEIKRVEINEAGDAVQVWLNEDQRSLAIGKGGKNILLASRLTGLAIQLVQEEPKKALLDDEVDIAEFSESLDGSSADESKPEEPPQEAATDAESAVEAASDDAEGASEQPEEEPVVPEKPGE